MRIFVKTAFTSLSIAGLTGWFFPGPPPATEGTQAAQKAQLAQGTSSEQESLAQAKALLDELGEQNRDFETLKQQIKAEMSQWNTQQVQALYEEMRAQAMEIRGMAWAAADNLEQINESYPQINANIEDDFNEFAIHAKESAARLRAQIINQLNVSHEWGQERLERLDVLNERINSAEGQAEVMAAYGELLELLRGQFEQLGNSLNHQTTLMAHYLTQKASEAQRRMAAMHEAARQEPEPEELK